MSVTDKKSGAQPNTVYVKSAIYLKCISCLILLQLNSSYAATPSDDSKPEGVKSKLLHLFRPDETDSASAQARSSGNKEQKIVVTAPIEGPKFTYIAPSENIGTAQAKKSRWPWAKSTVDNAADVATLKSASAPVQTQPMPPETTLQAKKLSTSIQTNPTTPIQSIAKPTLTAVIRPPASSAMPKAALSKKSVWKTLFPSAQGSVALKPYAASASQTAELVKSSQGAVLPLTVDSASSATQSGVTAQAVTAKSKPDAVISNSNIQAHESSTASKGLWQRLFATDAAAKASTSETLSPSKKPKSVKKSWFDAPVAPLASKSNSDVALSVDGKANDPQAIDPKAIDVHAELKLSAAKTRSEKSNLTPNNLSNLSPDETSALGSPAAENVTKTNQRLWQKLFPTNSSNDNLSQTIKAQPNQTQPITAVSTQALPKTNLWSKWFAPKPKPVNATEMPQPVLSTVISSSTAASPQLTTTQPPLLAKKSLWSRLFPSSSAGVKKPLHANDQNAIGNASTLASSNSIQLPNVAISAAATPLQNQAAASAVQVNTPEQVMTLSPATHSAKQSFWQRWFKPAVNQTAQSAEPALPSANHAVKIDLPEAKTEPNLSVNAVATPEVVATVPELPRKTLWQTLFPSSNTVNTVTVPVKVPKAKVEAELGLRRELELANDNKQNDAADKPSSSKQKSWWSNPFTKSKNVETTDLSASEAVLQSSEVAPTPVLLPTEVQKNSAADATQFVSTPILSAELKPSVQSKKSVWQRLFPTQNANRVDQVAPLNAMAASQPTLSHHLTGTTPAAKPSSNFESAKTVNITPENTADTPKATRKGLWARLFPTAQTTDTVAPNASVPNQTIITLEPEVKPQVAKAPMLTAQKTPSNVMSATPETQGSNNIVTQDNLSSTVNAPLANQTDRVSASKAKQSQAKQSKVKSSLKNSTVDAALASSPVQSTTNVSAFSPDSSVSSLASTTASTTASIASRNQVDESTNTTSVTPDQSINYTVLQPQPTDQTWSVAPKPVAKVKMPEPTENVYKSWMIEPRPSFGERVWDQSKNFTGLLAPQPDDSFRYLDIQKLSNFTFDQSQAQPAPTANATPAVELNSSATISNSAYTANTQQPLMYQPRMSISDAVRLGVLRHPQITQSISRLAAQNANIDIAKSQYYPQLSTGIATGDLTSSERGAQQLTLNLQQALFDFGKIKTNVNTEQAKLQVEQANVLLNIDDIAFKIANAIVNIKRYQAISEIAKQQVDGTKRILDIAKLRAQAGISSQADPVQAQTYLESAQSNLIAQQSLLRENQLRLRTLVGVDLSRREFDIPDDLVQISDLYQEPEFNKIPSMIVAQSQVEVAKSQRKQTELSRYPTLSVRGSLSQSINGRNNDNNQDNSTSSAILLEATSNFYQGGLNASQVKSASFAEQAAKAEVNSVYLDVLDRIRTFREQIENKQEQIKVLVDRQQSTIRTRELYQEQYKLGTRTVLDLLNAEQAIHASNTELQNARYDIYNNLIQYIATTGRSRDAYDLNSLTIQGVEIQP